MTDRSRSPIPGPRPPRAVLVTGAASGIGAARAPRLGWRVFAGVRRPADAATLAGQASSWLTPLELDITNEGAVAAAAEAIGAAVGSGGLAGLVNNAGIAVAGPLEFLPVAAPRRQLEVNVVGQIAVTRAALPLPRPARGRIVFVGSVSGRIAAPFTGPYHASTFALEALTDAPRAEARPWGIGVAIVEPGAIGTPIWARSVAAAEASLADFPPWAHARYGPVIDRMRRGASRAGAAGRPPETAVDAIVHALAARRPRTRYLVGRDARIGALLARLPDRPRDRLFAWRYPRHGR